MATGADLAHATRAFCTATRLRLANIPTAERREHYGVSSMRWIELHHTIPRYFTFRIIRMSGIVNPKLAELLCCAVTGVNLVCTIVPTLQIERFGRRALLLCSVTGGQFMFRSPNFIYFSFFLLYSTHVLQV